MKNEELEKYIKESKNNKLILTDLGKTTFIEGFTRLVNFYDLTRKNSENEERTFAGLKRIYDTHDFCYQRFCFSGRLPNVLLFGADTLGPNLRNCFLEMLCDKDEMYSERVNQWLKPHSRNFNAEDLDELAKKDLTAEEAIYMSPPKYTNPGGLYNWGNGYMTIFYRPEFIKGVNPPLYIVPPVKAIEKILIAWPKPLCLRC